MIYSKQFPQNLSPFSRSSLRPVTRRSPCPVCEKPDWCSLSEDESLVICMRVADGAAKSSKNGGYVHILRRSEPVFSHQPIPTYIESSNANLAPVSRRNDVYTALLDRLTLSARHSENLFARGLSDTEIARNLYSSVPRNETAIEIIAELAGRHDLAGIPGIYRESDAWRWVNPATGMLIPVRNVAGQIQGCQIRFDSGEARYKWLSSKGRPGGASSGAPVHFARPWRARSTGVAIVTEGTLKGDFIAEKLDWCVVAVAGVTSFRDGFGEWLRQQLPELREVKIAFDSDWHIKPEVQTALLRLIRTVKAAGLTGGLYDWSAAKGLDDLLAMEVAA